MSGQLMYRVIASLVKLVIVLIVVGVTGVAGSARAADPPIIFLPGIIGSELKFKNPPNEIAWGELAGTEKNLAQLAWPIGADDDPRFDADGLLKKFRAYVIGGERGYAEFDCLFSHTYNSSSFDLFRALKCLQAQIGPSSLRNPKRYYPFPYDWRYSMLKTACKLKTQLDDTSLKPFNDAVLRERALHDGVVLVGHSMGAIVANLFAHFYAPSDTAATPDNPCPHRYKVRMVIAIGAPNLGAGVALKWMVDTPGAWLMDNFKSVSIAEKHRLAYSVPSFYELMPSYSGCCLKGKNNSPPNPEVADPLSIETWKQYGWLPEEVKADPQWTAHAQKYLESAKHIRKILMTPLPADVAVVLIAGQGTKTVSRFYTDKKEFAEDDGDETVPVQSADPPFPYPTLVPGRRASSDHLGLTRDEKVYRQVTRAISLVGKPLAEMLSGIKDVGAATTQVATRDGPVAARWMNLSLGSETLKRGAISQVTVTVEREVPRSDGTTVLERVSNIDPAKIKADIDTGTSDHLHPSIDAQPDGSYSIVFQAPNKPGTLSLTVTLPGAGMNRSALIVVTD